MTPADLRNARKLLERHGYRVIPPDEPSIHRRFWEKVQKTPDGCWQWLACTDRKGYGLFSIRSKHRGAHRVSWEIANGRSVPAGLVVMHSCDSPGCVNPEHLSVGTGLENNADKVAKGRHPEGAAASFPKKLDRNDVLVIRTASATSAALSRQFGISESMIRAVRSRKAWAHVE